jgi:hypothetical protein
VEADGGSVTVNVAVTRISVMSGASAGEASDAASAFGLTTVVGSVVAEVGASTVVEGVAVASAEEGARRVTAGTVTTEVSRAVVAEKD